MSDLHDFAGLVVVTCAWFGLLLCRYLYCCGDIVDDPLFWGPAQAVMKVEVDPREGLQVGGGGGGVGEGGGQWLDWLGQGRRGGQEGLGGGGA